MSYKTVKDMIAGNLKENGFDESSTLDFRSAAANEYSNTFIIKSLSGENTDEASESISDRFFDVQQWQIEIAFSMSEHNEINNLDELHRQKDALIAYLDKPTNWANSVKLVKYLSWDVIETANYFVLQINLKVIDQYVYT